MSNLRRRLATASVLALAWASAAAAAEAPAKTPSPPETKSSTVSEIVVTGERKLPGAVVGDIVPEQTFAPEDISALGVSNIADLLDQLAPQVRSDRGRGGEGPVILLNGHRISGFQELRDIPPEAILRAEVLPEQAALKYGYSANQRVVNIVLKPTFRSETVELGGGGPTAGGSDNESVELGVTRVIDSNPLNFNLRYNRQSSITEAERNLTSLTLGQPFDLAGNVRSPTPGGEIDPALSALANRVVTVAGVPAAAATRAPTLADFLATAGTPNATDVRRYRTLVPDTQRLTANAVYSRNLPGDIKATVNGTFEANTSDSQRGLPGVSLAVPAGDPFSPFSRDVQEDRFIDAFGPLRSSSDSWNGHLGLSVNKDLSGGRWRLSLTSAYDHANSRSESDEGVDPTALQAQLAARAPGLNPFGTLPTSLLALRLRDTGRSITDSGNIQFVASGPILSIPAGQVRTSLKVGASGSKFSSSSERLGLTQQVDLTRSGGNLQVNLDVPLTSRRYDVLSAVGDLTANANVAVEQVSDYGTLTTYGYGLNWRPMDGLSVLVSYTHDQNAPGQGQLGNPRVQTPGVRIFDFQTGQTVDVIQVNGGNRLLRGDDRDVTSVRFNFKPWDARLLVFSGEYVASRIHNPIVTFPAATADIEAAFPDRFLRDAQGRLVQVDYRPVNFASQDRTELRWGFNYALPIGPFTKPQGRRFGPPGGFSGPPGGGFGPPGGFGGGFGPPRGGPGAPRDPRGVQEGRFTLSIYHTVFFENRYLVRAGGPVIDFLDGGAMGGSGGQPRHEVEANLGVTERGLGMQLAADWKSGTSVRGGSGPASDLDFSDIAKINLRLFAELSQRPGLMAKAPWLADTRVTVSLNNLFDQRMIVHDGTGAVPLSYQPAYVDPTGRTWRISVRKLFH